MNEPLIANDETFQWEDPKMIYNMDEEVILGYYDIISEALPAEGRVNIKVKPVDMVTYWKRCGMLADFVAAFYSTAMDNSELLENSISTIFNELMENAVKCSVKRDSEVNINLKLYDTVLKIEIENVTTQYHYNILKGHMQNLLTNDDLESVYYKTLSEKIDPTSEGSGIGILLLMKDYPTKIGAKLNIVNGKHIINVQLYYYLEEV
jgi:hypothetical protein